MKIKKTKLVSIMLMISMMATVFAGCGGDKDKDKDATSGGASTNENFNATGYPIVDEQETISVLYCRPATRRDFEDNKAFQELEKLTNVKVDWQYQSEADWGDQKGIMLASDELPDVFFGDNALTTTEILANLDLFIPLEDMIDKYCPNIKAAFEAEPELKKLSTAADGHIYALANKLPMRPKACDEPFVNKAWLDRLGLEVPTTIDEWYDVMKAFKEKDANGNGDPNDEIPFGGENGSVDMGSWIRWVNPWGIVDSLQGNYLALDQETEKPVFIPADERYKEAVKFFEKMYKEGLMDQEYFTMDGTMSDAKLRNEEVSLVGFGMAWEVKSMTNPHSDEYEVMLPLAGPNGDRYVRGNDQCIIYRANNFEITTACKNPEVAIRWADAYASDDMTVQTYWGPYGEVLEKADDGTITFLDPPEGKNGDTWYWELSPRDHGPKYISAEFEAKIQLPEGSGDALKLEQDELLKEYVAKPFPVVAFTTEEIDQISSITTDIYKYINEEWAKWITSGGIDEEWDAYIEQLNSMGLEDLMKIYNEAYDRYKAA